MKRIGSFMAGLLIGAMFFSGTVAYAAGIIAERSSHRFFVDGKEVEMTAYGINGNNYVMLRDIGKAVGFNLGLAAGTMSKLNKGEDVALSVLLRICDYLDCDIGDICEAVRTNDARS